MEILFALLFMAGVVMLTGVRVLREYERAVVFRLGRARKQLSGPGMVLMLPLGIDRARTVDTRTKVVQIPPQEVITQDNISVMVDAVVYITVESPMHAVLEVEQYMPATLQLAATTMRAVIGRMDLDEILAHRDRVNDEVRTILDTRTEQWGVEISAVELKDIVLPQEMKRALARQAEAERERRAKIIAAEGELQAAAKLSEAADVMSRNPAAMQLRLYQTMVEISGEPASKIVLPIPIEIMSGMGSRGANVEQITAVVKQVLGSATAVAAAPTAPAIAAAKGSDAGVPAPVRVRQGEPPSPAAHRPVGDDG
ncbi:MAG: slipin family protein [Deltaproteobacteria bacterium]|jgi:regulator of protease activity HflC (stomatin/prohibitin superfamily)|nr:slipin family protein [Deltaproteobacteria bacterium]MBK8716114.1 slipin family protein [Deltaproteobacteria bacterium]MBP7286813.1 slipin family protein [Nannocystaceae bacterium]